MTPQEFTELLNGDLALEYAAAIQYRQHGEVINGLYAAFASELFAHAEEELAHARKVSEMIVWFGGKLATEVAPRYTSNDNLAMLQQDLDGEDTAIARYQERIAQALDGGFYQALYGLQEILSEEAGHRNDIKTYLGRA